ncbi:hypothetical protein G9A89_016661 [Geosiphon pyriformis]|nr:hypothetical protein G9A89_016661 [Geosiphon pyriformis]
MNNYFLDQNIQNTFYTLHEYWIKNYPNATLTIGKQTTITDSSGTHTVIRPKKTTTRRERIGSKMNKYLLESIIAAILIPFTTLGKTIKEILPIDKNLSYGRQLELYGCLGKIIDNIKLMKKTTSKIQAEILGIIRLDVPKLRCSKHQLFPRNCLSGSSLKMCSYFAVKVNSSTGILSVGYLNDCNKKKKEK